MGGYIYVKCSHTQRQQHSSSVILGLMTSMCGGLFRSYLNNMLVILLLIRSESVNSNWKCLVQVIS